MPADLPLRCICGELGGVLRGVSPSTGNRVVCYCDDCQSFAHFLGGADRILDRNGGTDIFQISPARLEFTSGAKHLACVRLRPKSGLTRWYSACCKTPIGNTVKNLKDPFVGIILHFAKPPAETTLDDLLGAVRVRGNARYAKGDRASLAAHDRLPLSYWFRLSRLVLSWRLRGDAARSPFLDGSAKLVAEPHVLGAEELRRVEAARDASSRPA